MIPILLSKLCANNLLEVLPVLFYYIVDCLDIMKCAVTAASGTSDWGWSDWP